MRRRRARALTIVEETALARDLFFPLAPPPFCPAKRCQYRCLIDRSRLQELKPLSQAHIHVIFFWIGLPPQTKINWVSRPRPQIARFIEDNNASLLQLARVRPRKGLVSAAKVVCRCFDAPSLLCIRILDFDRMPSSGGLRVPAPDALR